jgi:hypothetical protein
MSIAQVLFYNKIGDVFPHKLAVTETNPDECRPLLTHPWHADGPPSDIKEINGSWLFSNDDKERARIRQLADVQAEDVRKHPKFQFRLTVIVSNRLEGLS